MRQVFLQFDMTTTFHMQDDEMSSTVQKIHGKLRIIFLVLILIMIQFSMGCRKLVKIDLPETQIVTEAVFQNSSSATSAQTSIYSQMGNDGLSYYTSFYTGLSGDEFKNYSATPDVNSFYNNSLIPLNGLISRIWNSGYNYIYRANAVMEGLNNSNNISPKINSQLSGEALFIRAFWHYYLTSLYGDIPIITSTDYKVNSVLKGSSSSAVLDQIISDLKDAKSKLSATYVDATDTAISTERVRPTRWAASALLARVYLTKGDYLNAESESSEIINNGSMFSLLTDLNQVFIKNSTESIWQLQSVFPGINTPDGAYFILGAAPAGSGSQNCSQLSIQLISAFESGDNRKIYWIHDTTILGNKYSYPFKYKIRTGSSISEYTTVLRLSEQYLIRAEARTYLTKISEAQSDLNVIRARAGLPNTTANDKSSLLTAILHERQTELFTEWGHRWIDLKRSGTINNVMNIVCPLKNGVWNSNWALWPIPQNERNNDPNLSQNPGY